MYVNPKTGPAAATTAAPTLHLASFRRNILAVIVGNEVFTPAEQLRANHAVHECQDGQKLALWLQNVRRVAAEREQARALTQAVTIPADPEAWATPAQCDEIFALACRPCLLACEKSQALNKLPTLTQAGAVRYIGWLYRKVLRRTGKQVFSDGSTLVKA